MVLLRPRRRPLPVVLIGVAGLVVATLAPTSADVVRRPDLMVTKGSVAIAGDQAQRIKGGFTVRNAGGLPARSSTAHVQVRSHGAWRYLTELRILALGPKKNAPYAFSTRRPDFVGLGSRYPVRVCLDVKKQVREVRESNNCEKLGTINLQLVEDEVDYQPDTRFFHSYNGVGYYGWVPSGYEPNTQTTLFVWLHGCGGYSEFDIANFHASPQESFVTVAPVGREGACWHTPSDVSGGDEQLVANVIDDVARHFNVDLGNIVLGGYSSGGDLAYRIGYLFSSAIDAVLAANTAPFRDTGLTPDILPTVERKFRVVHLAHLQDDTYPIATVRSELQLLTNAGFAVSSVERAGSHYDDPGAGGLPGTDADIKEVLLPLVDP